MLDPHVCEKARLSRDARFDGLFFIGVQSTGIYCRPICPARSPKPENIVYYPSAAAAAAAGLRPCRRCRPESSPGTPAWNGTSTTVARAMALIQRGALNNGDVETLAGRVGVGSRHLRRLFKVQVGVSPLALAMTHRLFFAKKLIHETPLSFTEIAFAAGFGSIRRFNAAFAKQYGASPSAFRRRATGQIASGLPVTCELVLPYRPPYDWRRITAFYRDRAIPGVEQMLGDTYSRTIRVGEDRGWIAVKPVANADALCLKLHLNGNRHLMAVVQRVRRMFDLDANPVAIYGHLKADPVLAPVIERYPGMRLPGVWDPFEMTVRAVVGQQISVKAARTVAGRIACLAGPPLEGDGVQSLKGYFPTAGELLRSGLASIGMPQKRRQSLLSLAEEIASGRVDLEIKAGLADFVRGMVRLPGIGDWTANYIAMRALGEPDAFPAADLGIIKALTGGGRKPSPKMIRERAERWRPWRAYAAMLLWNA